MSKQRKKLTKALQDSLDSAGQAFNAWHDIEQTQAKKRPYASLEERFQGEDAKDLLKELKSLLDRFS